MKPNRKLHQPLHLIVVGFSLAVLSTPALHAATETWLGATATWNTSGNWSGTNLPPVSGDSLVFGAAGAGGTTLGNDLTSPAFTIAGVTFNTGASAFTIGGNAFTLTGGITNNATAETINTAITLSGNQGFTSTVAGTLTFGGNITGTGVTLTTNGGTAGNIVAANTVFKGSVSLASLLAQGKNTSGQVPANNQTTTFDTGASLATTGNVVVGRSNLVFKGNATATIGGNLTNAGAASIDWGKVTIQDTANVTAAALLMNGNAVTGHFNLIGGTLTTGSIAGIDSTDGTYTLRNILSGTQIIASQNNTNFLSVTKSTVFAGSSQAFVGNNGALFNSNGFSIRTTVNLLNDTGATGFLTKSGAGSLTLAGANGYAGPTTVNGGALMVNGSLAAASAVAVNGGASLGGTGTVNGPVTVASGATAGNQGTISLVDGALGTFNLANAAGLTLGGAVGNSANLKFEAGAFASDLLSLGGNVLTVGAGGASITITGTGVAAGNTYDLISFGSGAGTGFAIGSGTTVGALTLANPNITFGVSGSLTVTAGKVQLVTSGASAPSVAYWSGVKGTTWASNDGTNGNFTTNPNGTGFVGAYPSAFSDVIFAANGNGAPVNLTNTLGQDFEVNGIAFAAGTAAASISGGNQLTVGGGGVTVESGNGGATLAMNALVLGATQTWSNAGSNNLAVSAAINGTAGLIFTNTGSGKTILSGVNTYSGGTYLTEGVVQLIGGGTLGAAAGILSVEGGALDLNGTSQTVGTLTGSGGTILNNSTSTASTLSVGAGSYGGVIADHTTGTGTTALTKTGGGTLALLGANTYTGKTTINGGTLQTGANECIANTSVVEINNGGKFALQAFTETIGGLSSVTGNANLVQNQETGGEGVGTLVIDTAGGGFSFDGILRNNYQSTGTLAIVKNGSGVQTITATNAFLVGTSIEFTGGLTINGGTMRLWDQGVTNTFYPNGKVISTFASDVTNNATLALDNTGLTNVTFSKVISGTGAVTTSGLVTLTATNTYVGGTTVGAGTLSITHPYLADGSSVSIAATGKLDLAFAGSDTVASLTIAGSPAAAGTWGTTASGAAHPDDTHFSGTGTLQVGAAAPTYATWAATNAGGQASNLDFDNDGVQNGVEYFMGATGSSFTANPAIIADKIIWPKDPAFSGSYTVQTSSDLTNWTNGSSTVVGNTIEYNVPQNQGKFFIRLSVAPN